MSEVCTIEGGEPGCALLTGVLTFKSTPGLYRETEKLFQGSAPVSSIDLSGVTSVDSAGLALLLEWKATQDPLSRNLNLESRQKVLDAKGVVRTLNKSQKEAWRVAMKPVWDTFSGEIGQDLIDAAASFSK